MKPILRAIILLLAFAISGNGEAVTVPAVISTNSITTTEGKVFRGAKILRREGDAVVLQHEAGVSTIAIDALAPECRDAIYMATTSSITAKPRRAENLCTLCSGIGFTRCSFCQGGKFGPPGKVKVDCSECDGIGRKSHYYRYGTIQGGAGARNRDVGVPGTKACPKCDGTGKIEVEKATYCKECGGTGSTRCTACQGSGKRIQ